MIQKWPGFEEFKKDEKAIKEFMDVGGQKKEIKRLGKDITRFQDKRKSLSKQLKKHYDLQSKDKFDIPELAELIDEKNKEK